MVEVYVSAGVVDEGVGIPPVWKDPAWGYVDGPYEGWRDGSLELADDQTAFGLTRKLDAWELASGDEGAAQWTLALAELFAEKRDREPFYNLLRERVHRIGMDHAIRRALGEKPQPGTLAEFGLMQPHEQWWRFDARRHGGAFVEWDRDGKFIGSAECGKLAPMKVGGLAQTEDSMKGLMALFEEMCDVY